MTKRMLSLVLVLAMVLTLFAGLTITAHATEDLYYTLDGTDDTQGNNAYASVSEVTQSGIKWSVMANTKINPWRIGGKNLTKVDREVYTVDPMELATTKVELAVGTKTATVHSITLIVASDASFENKVSTISKSYTANSTLTFTPGTDETWASGYYYKFVFNVTCGGSNQYVQLTNAKFYWDKPAEGNTVAHDANHDVQQATGTPATCTENGTLSYWYCNTANCELAGKKFEDQALENELDSIVDPQKDHIFTNWTDNGDGTCTGICSYNCGTTNTLNHTYENGACTNCGAVEPAIVTLDKVNAVASGDQVAIVLADGTNLVTTYQTEYTNKNNVTMRQLRPATPNISGTTLTTYAPFLFTVTATSTDGVYYLKTADGKYLTADVATGDNNKTGNELFLANAEADDNKSEWTIETKEGGSAGDFYLVNQGVAYNSNKAHVEFYNNFTTYTYDATKDAIYKLNFYRKAAVLTGITLGGTYATEFTVGDTFSHEGLIVTASYDNGTTKDVTADATFTGYNMSQSGQQTVTVSYTEGEVTKTATYDIQVNAVVIPDEVTFYVRDENQKSGLHFYAFGGTGAAMTWPGADMHFEGLDYEDKGIFSYTVNRTAYEKFIINYQTGEQTGDLTLADYATAAKVAYRCKSGWALEAATDFYLASTETQVSAPTCSAAEKLSYTGIMNGGTIEVDGAPATDHVAAAEWSHDETGHWNACTYNCGTKLNFAAHEDNNNDGACDTCGYVMPVTKQAVIVADDGNGNYFAMSNEFSTSGNNYKEVSLLANGKISTSEADGCVVTLSYISDTVFTISNGTSFLGWESGTNFVLSSTAVNAHYQWAEGTSGITCQTNNGRWIRYNNTMTNANRFRPYDNATGYKTYLVEIDNTPIVQVTETKVYVIDENNAITNYYLWNNADNSKNNGWPGADMPESLGKDKDGYNVYELTVDKTLYDRLILDNGAGRTDNNGWQTGDITIGNVENMVVRIGDGGAIGTDMTVAADTDYYLAETEKNKTAATCTEDGSVTYTGGLSGEDKTFDLLATGHNYENGVCTVCHALEPTGYAIVARTAIAGGNYYLAVKSGDAYYLVNGTDEGDIPVNQTGITLVEGKIASTDVPADALLFTLSGDTTNGFTFKTGDVYLGVSDYTANRKLAFSADYSDVTWTIGAKEAYGDNEFYIQAVNGEKTYTVSNNAGVANKPIRGYQSNTIGSGLYLFYVPAVTASYSLTTGAKIGVNLYFQNLPAGAKVYKTDENSLTEEILMKDGSYTIDVAAKDYASTFTITATTATGDPIQINGRDSLTVSVAAYIADADDNATPGKDGTTTAGTVVKAMSNFAKYAEGYFGGTAPDPTDLYGDNDVGMGLASVTAAAVREELEGAQLIPYRDPTSANASVYFYAGSLVLESETILRLYFYAANANLDNLTNVKVNGNAIDLDAAKANESVKINNTNYIQIDVPLAAKEIGNGTTVEITYNGATAKITNYSGLYYIWQTLKNSNNEDLLNVVKALYVYYKNALAYFGED